MNLKIAATYKYQALAPLPIPIEKSFLWTILYIFISCELYKYRRYSAEVMITIISWHLDKLIKYSKWQLSSPKMAAVCTGTILYLHPAPCLIRLPWRWPHKSTAPQMLTLDHLFCLGFNLCATYYTLSIVHLIKYTLDDDDDSINQRRPAIERRQWSLSRLWCLSPRMLVFPHTVVFIIDQTLGASVCLYRPVTVRRK